MHYEIDSFVESKPNQSFDRFVKREIATDQIKKTLIRSASFVHFP